MMTESSGNKPTVSQRSRQHNTHHRDPNSPATIVAFTCPHCSRKFYGDASYSGVQSNFRRHLFTHTNARPFPCLYCSMSFLTKQNMVRHCRFKHLDEISAKAQAQKADSSSLAEVFAASEGAGALYTPLAEGTSEKIRIGGSLKGNPLKKGGNKVDVLQDEEVDASLAEALIRGPKVEVECLSLVDWSLLGFPSTPSTSSLLKTYGVSGTHSSTLSAWGKGKAAAEVIFPQSLSLTYNMGERMAEKEVFRCLPCGRVFATAKAFREHQQHRCDRCQRVVRMMPFRNVPPLPLRAAGGRRRRFRAVSAERLGDGDESEDEVEDANEKEIVAGEKDRADQPEAAVPKRAYVCSLCELELATRSGLKRHRVFYCPFRDDAFADEAMTRGVVAQLVRTEGGSGPASEPRPPGEVPPKTLAQQLRQRLRLLRQAKRAKKAESESDKKQEPHSPTTESTVTCFSSFASKRRHRRERRVLLRRLIGGQRRLQGSRPAKEAMAEGGSSERFGPRRIPTSPPPAAAASDLLAFTIQPDSYLYASATAILQAEQKRRTEQRHGGSWGSEKASNVPEELPHATGLYEAGATAAMANPPTAVRLSLRAVQRDIEQEEEELEEALGSPDTLLVEDGEQEEVRRDEGAVFRNRAQFNFACPYDGCGRSYASRKGWMDHIKSHEAGQVEA